MPHPQHNILVVGASRGLGHAIAAEFLKKDWNVMGTVRGTARTLLHDLADAHPGRVEIESLDITHPGQIQALRERLLRSWATPAAALSLRLRPARLLQRLTADVDALDSLYLLSLIHI